MTVTSAPREFQRIAAGRPDGLRASPGSAATWRSATQLAVVLEGVYARYVQHQTVGEGFEHEGLVVPTLVARAHQVLDADD